MVKKILRSPVTTVVLFVLAAGLLLTGTIGGVRAAPLLQSDAFQAQIQLTNIGAALTENGTAVAGDDALLTNLVPQGETFTIGKTYDEALAVTNTGDIDVYVRVTVYKYWTDSDGKAVDLKPELIILNFPEGSGWVIDENASTDERTVLYYTAPVAPGASTPSFVDTLTISSNVSTEITREDNGSHSYDYGEVSFHVEAVADAVQEHNGEAATRSAWGDNSLINFN